MIDRLLAKVFGTQHERDIKKMLPRVERINALEPSIHALSDEELRGKTVEFRQRIAKALEGVHPEDLKAARDAVLDEILEEAFAVAREASVRTLGMRPFDVQLIGGMVLHGGKIAEMKTGEGKTLVATMPVYLNALTGRGVHVVTVNDYLARRDADWMGRIYRFLGLTVGCIQNSLLDEERQKAYASDVTYGTNNEFGFDYLRDNMKFEIENMVQRGHVFAIVDEVDSILIDEARTPLIISGPSEENTEVYYRCNRVIPHLVKGAEDKDKYGNKTTTGDFLVDEKARTAVLTEEGVAKAEQYLGIDNMYDLQNIDLLHGVEQALRAHALYKRDVDYMIKDGQVLIVDEFTGRVLPGRRWSDGLHQAVEAKENVKIERENQTLATITLQNYFRLYEKLAGMTGTADTEAAEFHEIYKLDVVVIPTNRPMIREDNQDVVYASEREKYQAVAEEIVALREKGQPVLVGTVSIEKSERLSEALKQKRVPHVVLNAKFHEKEAEIVVQAGRSGAVTIATNMAGRGTDIVLGGNPEAVAAHELKDVEDHDERERKLAKLKDVCAADKQKVLAAGGLHIIGTERHESRRVDNQLRGRSGRQGDPGSSRFYLSLEDDLMRIFGSDRLQNIMRKLGMEEGVPIEHGMVSRSIERAQKQVEARNFESRKHLLEYDDVMNRQREEIYGMRRGILRGELARDHVLGLAETILDYVLGRHLPEEKDPQEWDLAACDVDLQEYFGIKPGTFPWAEKTREQIREELWKGLLQVYDRKEGILGAEMMRTHEKFVMLQVVDQQWKDHLLAIDHLKEGIGLRGYGQRDPLIEYKKESFELFTLMKERIEDQIVQYLFKLQPVAREESAEDVNARTTERRAPVAMPARRGPSNVNYSYGAAASGGQDAKVETMQRSAPKVGRNDPCPCGSGKKYKKCHGADGGPPPSGGGKTRPAAGA
ncbi:MAG TPA: preprotein translocase subunit SecA [Thermoanaerobaculia bacterium]|nr:preprotein translocase subunit SecA [Thermoanaerobaculia bacterium]